MAEEMVIFSKTYDFVSWIIPLTLNFPKQHRFIITSRLQNAVLAFQERIIEANAERGAQRGEKLRQADAELLKIRLYLRLCRRWDWLKDGQYHQAAEMVAELGRLLGGWQKSVTSGSPDPQ
jgi:four helix bundle protein